MLILCLAPHAASGQTITQRGFADARGTFFPQDAPNDTTNAVGDFLLREEVFLKAAPWVQFGAGIDVRANSHDQVDDRWTLDLSDRGARRPRLSVRRLTATIARGWLTVDAGKQFIRWGKADIVNPTDRFAPRDFLNLVDNDFLAVTAARAVVQIAGETIDVVWSRFTPSRIPLLDQRWAAVPVEAAAVPIVDAGASLPRRSEVGVRWGHIGHGFEASVSLFDGFNHLPNIESTITPPGREIGVRRVYPPIRSFGGDAAVPLRWLTLKGEAAYFTSPSPQTDEYVLYVIQIERQTGEWLWVAGYVGEAITSKRAALTFAPDRGAARSVIGRGSYTIDPNRSVAFEGAVRRNGDGGYAKGEYSQAYGQHWRATATGTYIGGKATDFFGQYHRNSNVEIAVRYSF